MWHCQHCHLHAPETSNSRFLQRLWKTWMQNLTSDHQHRSDCPWKAGTNGVSSVDSKPSCSPAITHCVQLISSMFMHFLSSTRKGWLNQQPRNLIQILIYESFCIFTEWVLSKADRSVAEWDCWVPLWLTKIVLGTECQSDNPGCCPLTLPTQNNTDLVLWETHRAPHQGAGLTAQPPTEHICIILPLNPRRQQQSVLLKVQDMQNLVK